MGLELGGAITCCLTRSSADCGDGLRLAECRGNPVQLVSNSSRRDRDACRNPSCTRVGFLAKCDGIGRDVAPWGRREVGRHGRRTWSTLQLADLVRYCRWTGASFADDEAPM